MWDSHWELNPEPPALAAGALTVELQLPTCMYTEYLLMLLTTYTFSWQYYHDLY